MKVAIAEACGIGDYNRVGIFDPATNKTFKNRQAKVADEVAIVKVREVLVKDLGVFMLSIDDTSHTEHVPQAHSSDGELRT